MAPLQRVPSATIDYQFRQRFHVSAGFAYRWATDYDESDWRLAGLDGRRHVQRLSETLVRLTDRAATGGAATITKVRLVQLYPEAFSWVSTHIAGPCLHSQFRYSIERTGRNRSCLTFRGREIRWERSKTKAADVRRLASDLRREDAALWKRFAGAMERDAAL